MKLKILTAILGLTTLTLGFSTCIFYMLNKASAETIADRELTITSYAKVIDAIGRSTTISLEELKTELIADFNPETMGYSIQSNEHYLIVNPIRKEISPTQIWNFMGLELVFDNQKALKSVHLYKP